MIHVRCVLAIAPGPASARAVSAGRLGLVGSLVALLATPAAAQQPPLAAFAGEWDATGEARTDYDAPFQPGFCHIETTYDGAALENDGRCFNEDTGFQVAGQLRPTGTGWDGGFFAIVGATTTHSAVTFRDDGILVEATYLGRTDDEVIDARVWLTYPENDRYGLVIEIRHPDTGAFYPVSRLTFVREE